MRRPLLLLSLALAAGCGSGVPPAQNYATVQGRAFDVATNAGVAGVNVCVDVVDCAMSGTDGAYRVVDVPLGSCHVYSIVPPQGYTVQGTPPDCGSVTAGQVVTIDIGLTHQ